MVDSRETLDENSKLFTENTRWIWFNIFLADSMVLSQKAPCAPECWHMGLHMLPTRCSLCSPQQNWPSLDAFCSLSCSSLKSPGELSLKTPVKPLPAQLDLGSVLSLPRPTWSAWHGPVPLGQLKSPDTAHCPRKKEVKWLFRLWRPNKYFAEHGCLFGLYVQIVLHSWTLSLNSECQP